MTIEQITEITAALNDSTPAPAKKKKTTVAAPLLSADAMLEVVVHRIVSALGLDKQGVTVDVLLTQVKDAEAKMYTGVVQ